MTTHIRRIVAVCWLCSLPVAVQAQGRQSLGQPPAPANDLEHVERVLAARKEYQHSLEALRQHYVRNGDVDRAKWVEEELLSFHRTPKRAFRLDLDVPPPTLQPAYNVPEANELYRRGMSYMGKGWFRTAHDNLRRSEILFQQLLTNHPQSDKIDDAAYQLGEIYESRTFKQYRRAAQYYERCVQWNPNTQTDARLKAARLYDRTLQERGKAIELYREVVSRETDQRRTEEARRRLSDLSVSPP